MLRFLRNPKTSVGILKRNADAIVKPCGTCVIQILSSTEPLASFLCSSLTKSRFFTTTAAFASSPASGSSQSNQEIEQSTKIFNPKVAADVFRRWGCTEADIDKIFTRRPSLRNADLANLDSKLSLLCGLGLNASDLVNIVNRRPRFLHYRVNRYFDERLDYLESFLGSRELLIKAIVRNPSLLTYDFQKTVTPVIEMFAQAGVGKSDFISMLLSRPTLIARSKLCEEKLDYISRTGVAKDSKMYKYVVAIIAISRVETVREKLEHFRKFGFSEDEILLAIGRSPLLLTLSTDKVQRNMTFVVGIMKLAAKVVLDHPFLLFFNLETTLKPRMQLACKIDEMGLAPQIKGPVLLTALRMADKRFVKAFISCHPPDVSDELLEFYRSSKGIKRLAVSSKKNLNQGFPF